MRKCNKCNVIIDSPFNVCPLCNSELNNEKNIKYSYPIISNEKQRDIFRKIIFFIACLICITILSINYFITPKIKWSIFVVVQLFATYYIFYNILNGRKKILKILLSLNIIICFLSIFWDFYSGYHGWSINYVFPALCISYGAFVLILRFVNYFAFKENSSYIYLNICLEFLPIILVYMGYAKPNILIYLSMIFGILNLIMLLAFDGSNFKDDIVKKLHI